MLKVSLFAGETENGPQVVPLFTRNDAVFEKSASASLLPDVVRYIDSLRPRQGAQYVLVNAMGAGEFFGSNINGDYFTEASLIHKPDNWTGNPLIDKVRAKEWAYGFPTFYYAHPYAHHRNKDATRAFGEVELAAWNDTMKRVELVCRVDKDKCQQFGGVPVWDKLHAGQYPDVSMGCKVPFDTCSICLDWKTYREAQSTYVPGKHKSPGEAILHWHKTKGKIRGLSITRADYCDHAKKSMNKILPDGRKVFVYNDYPKFFDISFVFIGADRTAKVMMKIAGVGSGGFWDIGGSAELAEKLGYADDGEKTASDHVFKKTEFQGIPVHLDRPKGFVQTKKDGTQRVYKTDYGFVPGTKDHDGEELDVYLGPNKSAPNAFVIDQMRGKELDEHKVMLGFRNEAAAKRMFLAHMPPEIHHRVIGNVEKVPVEELKSRLGLVKQAEEDDALKLAFLGKAAKSKKSEIVKDVVPSQFAGKAVPALTAAEHDLPRDLLDVMSKAPIEKALSTSGGLGIVLRPREFQRIVLVRMGKRGLADELDESGEVFPGSDERAPMDLGPDHFLGPLARLLLPFMSHRSALAPAVERRVVVISGSLPEKHKRASASHSYEVMRKISAAYNSYRSSLMNLAAYSQDLIEKVAYPSDSELRKLSSASPEEVFSPLSVAYIQSAFLDEVGPRHENGQQKLAMSAGVERGFSSKTT